MIANPPSPPLNRSSSVAAGRHRTSTESIKSRRLSTPRTICPIKGHIVLVNRSTGEVGAGACERLVCEVCRPAAAMRQSAAVAAAAPDIFITLTQVGDDWPTIRRRWNRFRATMRKLLPGWQDCYSVEANPRGTGHHIHGYAFTAVPNQTIDPNLFWNAAVRAGMGSVVDAQRFALDEGARHLGYGMKAAFHQPGSGAAGQQFLDLNGGRLLHATRGFFRDGPNGPVRTLSAAIKAAR